MVECCDMKFRPRIISEQRLVRTESFTFGYHSPSKLMSTVHCPSIEALSDDDAINMLPVARFICCLIFLHITVRDNLS